MRKVAAVLVLAAALSAGCGGGRTATAQSCRAVLQSTSRSAFELRCERAERASCASTPYGVRCTW
jgi:hypothetical protein